ncbi:MAG: YicC/YloC family endoribonuclease [Oscillospiraceae bacterium]
MGREFTVEVRAVNNRYLDCTVKLPRSLTFAEDSVKQRVKSAVARGKVDVLVSVGAASGDPVQVSLNRPVLEGYLQAMRAMVKDYGVRDDISAAALARLPEVFLVEKPKEDEDQLLSALLQVVDRALGAFDAMRVAEGSSPWRRICAAAGKPFWSWWPRWKRVRPRPWPTHRARLEAKMQEVLERTGVDESRILQEAAIFAD